MDEQEELQQLEQELNSIVGVSSDPLLRMLLLYLYSNTHLQIYELASAKLIVSSMREMLDLAKVHRNAARGERKNYDPNFDSELLQLDQRASTYYGMFQELRLVYACAVFDAFLDNITKYVYLRNPSEILKGITTEVSQLLVRTRSEMLTEQIEKKTQQTSRNSNFTARVRSILKFCGPTFSIPNPLLRHLDKIAETRNRIVHGSFKHQLLLDDNLELMMLPQTEPIHVDVAVDWTYLNRLAVIMYCYVVRSVGGRAIHPVEQKLLDIIFHTRAF